VGHRPSVGVPLRSPAFPWASGATLDIVSRRLAIGLGALLVVVGAVWTLQGLGYLGGSVMSGVTFWAVLGPVVALLGLLLAVVGGRGRR
jgi:hypothetical protein